MKLKKTLSKIVTCTLVAAMTVVPSVAFADTTDTLTMMEYTAPRQGAVICKASVGEEFIVKLPVAVQLDNNQAFSMPVSVQGDLVKGDVISVVPSNTVEMEYMTADVDHKKDSVIGQVTPGKTEFTFEELFDGNEIKDTSTTVMVSGLSAGIWQGQLTYDINLTHTGDAVTIPAGLYDEEDNLVKSWDDLLADGIVHDTDGVVTTNWNQEANVNESATALTGKLVISDEIISIESCAFMKCVGLTSVKIPNSVTSIGNKAFNCCSGLTSINIPNGITKIEDNVFGYCYGLTSITIPNSVTSIGTAAFFFCSELTSITIPDSVISIGEFAFNNCENIESISLPNSITSIGPNAFLDCCGLTSITIPNSVTSIGYNAFNGCTSLISVILSNNLTEIPNNVFEYDDALTTIYYSGTATGAPWGATNATIEANNTI